MTCVLVDISYYNNLHSFRMYFIIVVAGPMLCVQHIQKEMWINNGKISTTHIDKYNLCHFLKAVVQCTWCCFFVRSKKVGVCECVWFFCSRRARVGYAYVYEMTIKDAPFALSRQQTRLALQWNVNIFFFALFNYTKASMSIIWSSSDTTTTSHFQSCFRIFSAFTLKFTS